MALHDFLLRGLLVLFLSACTCICHSMVIIIPFQISWPLLNPESWWAFKNQDEYQPSVLPDCMNLIVSRLCTSCLAFLYGYSFAMMVHGLPVHGWHVGRVCQGHSVGKRLRPHAFDSPFGFPSWAWPVPIALMWCSVVISTYLPINACTHNKTLVRWHLPILSILQYH